ncbi:hypothetical protein DT250_04075 [Bacillus sp. AR2-1]|uniref:hypothetical protein n=1 Tax=Bacillus sp. AR2-1 TaxID=2217816 RepID=UPI0011F0273D|nr:hypothetical protein [Bacillus sp. AR2-1]KAA0776167.1 hypothetical protein DT250_04075 [Bacillus sp. AR2-1]
MANHIVKAETLDTFWKERLNTILDEKDALRKGLNEVTKMYEELKGLKEKLAKDVIAEIILCLEAKDALKFMRNQLQSRDEDYNTLLNQFNAITEKNHELEHDLRKVHIFIALFFVFLILNNLKVVVSIGFHV